MKGRLRVNIGSQLNTRVPQTHSGVSIRDCHIGHTEPVEDPPSIISDVIENDTFPVVETNVDGPLLPFQYSTFDGELCHQHI
jgi:hypothetical protein